ncbi:MAG: CBS domain-containing protein [Armatimonadetes bacterium]|nr:CBS domain-containing protein [Armatimonadota bacterium]
MTKDVLAVRIDTPVTEIARLMAENKVSGVPVLDDADCVVGMVTENDLLLKHAHPKSPPRLALFGLWVVPEEAVEKVYRSARPTAVAEDVMTRDVVTFAEDDDIRTIAETMVKKGINRVPIVRGCKLVGIVSRADILRAIAEGK